MNERRSVNRIYRQTRAMLYCLAEPLDTVWRRINRLPQYPPIALRRHVGCLGSLDGVGMEFVSYLRLLMDLKPDDKVLDIGCGCGLLELALESSNWHGKLTGVDIHKPSIEWASRTITRRIPTFSFRHADIYNAAFWPSGKLTAGEWFEQYDETGFDILVAKSLFTHMLPDELDTYFDAIRSLLADGGQALLSFFLLNDQQRRLDVSNHIRFVPYQEGKCAVRNPLAPAAAVAYEERDILERLKAHSLRLAGAVQYGFWTGRTDGLSYQDLLIVEADSSSVSS